MAHERTYSERDPFLGDLRKVCLALPEAVEIEAWGRPTFRAGPNGKIFAMFLGGSQPFAVLFTPDPAEAPALRDDERFFVAKYHPGKLALDLTAADVDWGEVAELVETSYRLVAAKKLVKVLDDRG